MNKTKILLFIIIIIIIIIGHLSSVERSELDDKWFLEFPRDSFYVQRNLHRQYIRVCKS